MIFETHMRRTTASIALIAALAASPVAAQDNSATASSESQNQSGVTQSMNSDQPVASVGDTEITGADLVAFIDSLPPRMREQPPQMVVSMALQQVVLRELLLQEAEAQNLGEDTQVQTMVDEAANVAREDAMVQVYLQRELASRVTDEAVQQAYDQVAEQSEQELPPLEQVRPQIEQQLQQQAVQSLRQELAADVEVVIYGPDGEPMPGDSQSGEANPGDAGSASGSDETSSDSQ